MELSHKASVTTATAFKQLLSKVPVTADIVICPSFPELAAVADVFKDSNKVSVGAQNVHWTDKGAWTGEVSVTQIAEYVNWCIVGHSERRQLAGETDEQVAAKAMLLLDHKLTPIICIGETAAERDSEQTVSKITQQMRVLLQAIDRVSFGKVVIAYEPIWAIGTGVLPQPQEATEVMLLIRKLITEQFDQDIAEKVRILYGGSVKPDTIGPFVGEPGVDGVLVGGASVHPMDFVDIIKQVQTECILVP